MKINTWHFCNEFIKDNLLNMQTVSDLIIFIICSAVQKRPQTPKRLNDVSIMDGGVTAVRQFIISDSGCTVITWLTFEFQQDIKHLNSLH